MLLRHWERKTGTELPTSTPPHEAVSV